ncbi:MAG: ABC transporter substrate-binding protein [Pseudomonadota bacterium]
MIFHRHRLTAIAFFVGLTLLSCSRTQELKNELNVSVSGEIKSLDPAQATDVYSLDALQQVFEGLYEFDYLARPYRVHPLLAESDPVISDGGKEYRFKIREGIRFQDDPAFGGKPRFLKASDFVDSYKRIFDPHLASPNRWALARVADLSVPDDRTLVIRLTRPWLRFPYALAIPALGVMAREVVEKYGPEIVSHPVGTGPFALKEWVRGQRLRFVRNPTYWGGISTPPLPLVNQLTISIFNETQPRWLNFLKGNLDLVPIPTEAYSSSIRDRQLSEELAAKRVHLDRSDRLMIAYLAFNLDDPVIGKNLTLRRAISQAINRAAKIEVVDNGRGTVANGPIPPGLFGFDPSLRDPNGYDPEGARKSIAKLGKKIPELYYDRAENPYQRHIFELIAGDLAKIGITLKPRSWTFPQLLERINRRDFQMAYLEWVGDYPDPENFLQPLWGGNVGGQNRAGFRNAEFDALYEKVRDLPDGSERLTVIRKMNEILHANIPWVFLNYGVDYFLHHDWVQNYRRNQMATGSYKYVGVDLEKKKAALPLLK